MGPRTERLGDVVAVVPEGEFAAGAEIDALDKTLRTLVQEGQKKILLDLARTTFMDSQAIGVLVAVQMLAWKRGLHFFVCFGPENSAARAAAAPAGAGSVRDLIMGSEVYSRTLNLHDSREDALQALAKL